MSNPIPFLSSGGNKVSFSKEHSPLASPSAIPHPEDPSSLDADLPEDSSHVYKEVLDNIFESFPSLFISPPPSSPRSASERIDRALGIRDPKMSSPSLIWSDSVKSKLSKINDIVKSKKEKEKLSSVTVPQFLRQSRAKCYQVGKVPLFSSSVDGADFSSICSQSQRKSYRNNKVKFSSPELASALGSSFNALSATSFLDWTLGSFRAMLLDLRSSLQGESKVKLDKFLEFMAVADRTVGDIAGELTSMLANLILKKREAYLSALSPSTTPSQKSALQFGELTFGPLFDPALIKEISDSLDNLAQREKRPIVVQLGSPHKKLKVASSNKPSNSSSFSGGNRKRFRGSSFKGKRRPFSGGKSNSARRNSHEKSSN